jgi:hypothetical protein
MGGLPSCRAGFLTSAARRGASVVKMRDVDVSRHKSMDVLQAYVRDADLFRDHAGIGLLWGIRRARLKDSGISRNTSACAGTGDQPTPDAGLNLNHD